jgi:hypothetical protein
MIGPVHQQRSTQQNAQGKCTVTHIFKKLKLLTELLYRIVFWVASRSFRSFDHTVSRTHISLDLETMRHPVVMAPAAGIDISLGETTRINRCALIRYVCTVSAQHVLHFLANQTNHSRDIYVSSNPDPDSIAASSLCFNNSFDR